jgi:type VI secretion system secreted protein Hcp
MIVMKFEKEIKGESQIDGHAEWINVESFGWGASLPIITEMGKGERRFGRPVVTDATFTRNMDKASPELMHQLLLGENLKKAEIHFVESGGSDGKGHVYMKIELHDPVVSNYHMSGTAKGRPTEVLSLSFTKHSMQYDTFVGGTKKAGTPKTFDFATNKPF